MMLDLLEFLWSQVQYCHKTARAHKRMIKEDTILVFTKDSHLSEYALTIIYYGI